MAFTATVNNTLLSSLSSLQQRWLSYLFKFLGQALAFAFFILTMGFIAHQTSYDTWVSNAENKYRVSKTLYDKETGEQIGWGRRFGIYKLDYERLSDIKSNAYIQFFYSKNATLTFQDREFSAVPIQANASVLPIFDLALAESNDQIFDKKVLSAAISVSNACELFGAESAVGQVVTFSGIWHLKKNA